MLSNLSHFIMNNSNCHFIECNVAEGSGLKTLHDASLPDAAYDSAAREIALHFIPKTDHEDFVAEFVAWTRRTDSPVMRLTGPKSNLAQLCAEKVQEELAATFCFSESTTTEDPRRFFITLADQIATYIPAYAKILDNNLRRNPGLVSKSLKIQFEELIAAPIKELLARGVDLGPRRVIVVEGIDECASVHARCEIIGTILGSASGLPFYWAIFGLPDSWVEATLRERGLALKPCWKVCHAVPNFPVGEGEYFLRIELIKYQGWIAVKWTLIRCAPKITTGTALFFLIPAISQYRGFSNNSGS
ncbi:hypothetical protein P691DRAFT_706088 [Macrolepiota fuliginosa MF-IS2]|uniref:Nephrocystin 3-like N-terminal domain-containing protein n=1 Tax=Macrolepiota fuliginosa MF-IS2 TaxID=1400762 RepID=A0A9P6C1J2_9AGAR|nr:hypothetical protein P691DRAFT_706088 [Macrolepiota fuliginosa MF-IS2]